MIKYVDLFCFSPNGGTRKVAETYAATLADAVQYIDLLDRDVQQLQTEAEMIVVAAPVFAGRLPSVVREKLKTLDGTGKNAVALVVYGVRAYDDALLELVDLLTQRGFAVIAAGAFIAEHSMVPSVGTGRPDVHDLAEIKAFARKTEAKLDESGHRTVEVPGNRPYKDEMVVAQTPVSGEGCVVCGACANVCPTAAITIKNDSVETALSHCIGCLACKGICPTKARTLAPAHEAAITERLGAFANIYRENETYL